MRSRLRWDTVAILDTGEAEVGGLKFEASPGKVSMRSYLKNKLKVVGFGACLKR
jgi:hypothetical protein